MFKLIRCSVLSLLLVMMAACSSSSSSDDTDTTSYFRFYNASLNAGAQEVLIANADDTADPSSIGHIAFADVSSIITLEVGNYNLSIMRDAVGTEDEQVAVFETEVSLDSSMHSMQIMLGDAIEPELLEFKYDATSIEELDVDDEQLELYIANFSSAYAELNVYISKEDETFEQAQLISSLAYKSFSDLQILEQDDYIIYLTQVSSDEIVFQTLPINFDYMQTYILAVRDDSGIRGIAIDKISNSSIVYSYADEETGAQLRFYQSHAKAENIDIYLDDMTTEPALINLASGSLSDNISLDSNTYTVTTTDTAQPEDINLANLLLSIDEDDSKIMLLYPDTDDVHQGLVVEQQTRKLAFENKVRLINIGAEDQTIDVYFVKADETLNTTERYVKLLDYSEHKEITLLNQQYQIFVTTEDDNENLRSLYESEPLTLSTNENYLMIFEPDETSYSGFRLFIVEE